MNRGAIDRKERAGDRTHDRKIIVCDPDKCNGCRLCEYACAAVTDKSLNLRHARIRAVRIEPIFNAAVACLACEKPDCVNGCPTQAIVFDEKEKRIIIDAKKCDACGLCIERCRYGSITLAQKDNNAFVCDFCRDHKTPQCVAFCPKDALSYEVPHERSFQKVLRDIR
jgi:anaerobic carbon-monoxide dehydrogenase iron sulfur subunit